MLFYILRARGQLINKYTSIKVVLYILSITTFMFEIIPIEMLNYIVVSIQKINSIFFYLMKHYLVLQKNLKLFQ